MFPPHDCFILKGTVRRWTSAANEPLPPGPPGSDVRYSRPRSGSPARPRPPASGTTQSTSSGRKTWISSLLFPAFLESAGTFSLSVFQLERRHTLGTSSLVFLGLMPIITMIKNLSQIRRDFLSDAGSSVSR